MGAPVLGDLRHLVVAGDQDVGKGLVVAQQDVVARHQSFDQVALEQQCLDLAVRRDDLEPCGLGDHALQPVGQLVDLGISGHALLQVARLADVERLAAAIEHAVDAGAARQGLDRRRYGFDPTAERLRLAAEIFGAEVFGAKIFGQGLLVRAHRGPLAARRGILDSSLCFQAGHDPVLASGGGSVNERRPRSRPASGNPARDGGSRDPRRSNPRKLWINLCLSCWAAYRFPDKPSLSTDCPIFEQIMQPTDSSEV